MQQCRSNGNHWIWYAVSSLSNFLVYHTRGPEGSLSESVCWLKFNLHRNLDSTIPAVVMIWTHVKLKTTYHSWDRPTECLEASFLIFHQGQVSSFDIVPILASPNGRRGDLETNATVTVALSTKTVTFSTMQYCLTGQIFIHRNSSPVVYVVLVRYGIRYQMSGVADRSRSARSKRCTDDLRK